jgi:hypothetical protein
MTIEEQFQNAVKELEETRLNNLRATTCFFAMTEMHMGPLRDVLSPSEAEDETWSAEARTVFKFAMEHSDIESNEQTHRALYALLEKVESTEEIYRIGEQVCWMVGCQALTETEEEVDELLQKANECEHCREFIGLFARQALVMDSPLPPEAVYGLVHAGFGQDFRDLIWCDLEGTAFNYCPQPEYDNGPWKKLCEETGENNVAGFLKYVQNLKAVAA